MGAITANSDGKKLWGLDAYFTIELLESGSVEVYIDKGLLLDDLTELNFCVNNGDWVKLVGNDDFTTESKKTLELNKGDRIHFWGLGKRLYNIDTTPDRGGIINTDLKFNILGQIKTLLGGEDVNAELEVCNSYTFAYLFKDRKVVNAKDLILPDNIIASNFYSYMFSGCTLLKTPPKLPALTLGEYCYSYMFQGCTEIEQAPVLPAKTLIKNCYAKMFMGCSKLKYVKALFTSDTIGRYNSQWLDNTASKGTFVMSKDAKWDAAAFDKNGIPQGWEIIKI